MKNIIKSMILGLVLAAILIILIQFFTNPNNLQHNWFSAKPQSFSQPINQASNAVVRVYSQSDQKQELTTKGLGSGVIITDDGYILTNYHVIKDAFGVMVGLQNGELYVAKTVGFDALTDLAVIKIDVSKLAPIKINYDYKPAVGDLVFAIGNPYNLGQSVTHGIISALGRNTLGKIGYQNFIQIDAPINKGNSGGALINSNGDLVGINSYSLSQSLGVDVQGINFTIPYDFALSVFNEIKQHGRVIRGYLGVDTEIIYNSIGSGQIKRKGVMVTGVLANSPADSYGLKAGDLIVKFNDKIISDPLELLNLVSQTKPNTEVKLEILRDNKVLDIAVVISENLQ